MIHSNMETPQSTVKNWRDKLGAFFTKKGTEANLAPTAEDIQVLTEALVDAKTEIEGLTNQISTAQVTQTSLQTQITQAQATQTSLQTSLDVEKKTVASLTADNDKLKAENEKLKASNAEKNAKILGSQGITPVLEGQDAGTKDLRTATSYVDAGAAHNKDLHNHITKQ